MPVETNTWIAAVTKNYQFCVFLFSTFVICMGVARWWGKQFSHRREKTRRKKANLPIASLTSPGGSSDQSFTYSSLFKGGLLGIYLMLCVLMFVVGMKAIDLTRKLMASKEISQSDFLSGIPILMYYPIFMIPFVGYILSIVANKDLESQNWFSKFSSILAERKVIVLIVIVCWTASAASIFYLNIDGFPIIIIQLVITAILSLCLSYIIGAREGHRVADPTASNPLVKLEVVHGENLDRAWLYERTDSDYRFVTENGLNHIVPAANVKRIQGPIEL